MPIIFLSITLLPWPVTHFFVDTSQLSTLSQELQQLLRTQLQLQTTTTVEPSSLSPGAKINVGIKEPVTQFHLYRDLKFNFLCFLTDSVKKNTFYLIVKGLKNACFMPFSWLQIIIRRDRPLANDHPEGLSSWKRSSVSQVTLVTSARIQSRFHIVDHSRTIRSCLMSSMTRNQW